MDTTSRHQVWRIGSRMKNEREKQGRGMRRSFVPQHGWHESQKPLAPGAKSCPAFSGGGGWKACTHPQRECRKLQANTKLHSLKTQELLWANALHWLRFTRAQSDPGHCSALSCGAQRPLSQLRGSSFRGSEFHKEQAGDILRCPPWSQRAPGERNPLKEPAALGPEPLRQQLHDLCTLQGNSLLKHRAGLQYVDPHQDRDNLARDSSSRDSRQQRPGCP